MKKCLSGFLILCISAFISCKKKVDPVPVPSPNTITATYYIQATIAGTVKTFQRNVNGYLDGAGGSGTAGSNGSNQYSSSFAKYSLVNGVLAAANDNITISLNLPVSTPIQSDYDNFFVTGSKTYVATSDNLNGVFFDWMDENGLMWSTTGGIQTASVFTITGKGTDVVNSTSINWISATFNCTLYNGASSKTVTDGKLKVLILPFLP